MKRQDRSSSIIWGALGIYIAYEGYKLDLGTLGNPKSGFFIFWAGVVLAGLSFILFLQTFSQKDKKKKEEQSLWEGIHWGRGVKLILALLIYALVFKPLGFVISTFLLLIFLFKGHEPQKWSVVLVLSIATIAVCYGVFGVLLEMQFPVGILAGLFVR
jgi:putative tricarboxylic transport membrane protein